MDNQALREAVQSAVQAKVSAGEMFMAVDISHPIIANDPDVKHPQVKKIIKEMESNGDIPDYQATYIKVYPKPGKQTKARLWHPEGADISSYTATSQELKRPGTIASLPSSTEEGEDLPDHLL